MSKQDVMRELGKLVAANDLEGAAAYYTEDAVVHIDGTGPLTGEFGGRAAIISMIQQIPASVDSMDIDVHDMLFSDEHAVLLSRATLTRGDRRVTAGRVAVYHFSGDQISEAWLSGTNQRPSPCQSGSGPSEASSSRVRSRQPSSRCPPSNGTRPHTRHLASPLRHHPRGRGGHRVAEALTRFSHRVAFHHDLSES